MQFPAQEQAWHRPVPHRAARDEEEFFFLVHAVSTIVLWTSAPAPHGVFTAHALNWTERTCNRSTQLRDELIGCSETGTVCARSVVNTRIAARLCSHWTTPTCLQFRSVQLMSCKQAIGVISRTDRPTDPRVMVELWLEPVSTLVVCSSDLSAARCSICHLSPASFARATLCQHGCWLWPCVCLSWISVLSKRMDGSSWFFAWRLLSTYAYRLRCLTRKFVYQQSVCASLWNSVPNSAILPRDVDRRNVLSILDQKLKLDRRRSIKLTVPPSSDARPL